MALFFFLSYLFIFFIFFPQIPEQHRVGQLRPPADHHSQGRHRGPTTHSEQGGLCRGGGTFLGGNIYETYAEDFFSIAAI